MEVREERTSTDSEGNSHTSVSWERREDTLETLERRCSFALRQGNQQLKLDPTAADLELETVFSNVEPASAPATHNTRPLGTRREEAILRPNGMVFVVAECSDSGGALQLQAPLEAGLFVVRRGGEEAFSRSIRRWRRIWTASSWVLTCAAAATTLASLLQR
nr:E3 ubiquitin ligase family protein [Synechococcus sp. HK05]